jgi:RimJ/RimL family protein N-acetyltransferase
MMITIEPMSKQDATEISSWRYPAPYSMYNLTEDNLPILLNIENKYYSVYDGPGELLGFCCFGKEARVPGGNYLDEEPEVLDVGLGMRPEKLGQGYGKSFIGAILAFAMDEFEPVKFRVSIAAFNLRSQRAFLGQGFIEVTRFGRDNDGMEFVQLEKEIFC